MTQNITSRPWTFFNPVRIRFGCGVRGSISGLVGNRHFALLCSPGGQKRIEADPLLGPLLSRDGLVLVDSIKEEVLKSGLEIVLAWLYFVTGVLELSQGDFASASSNIENAFDLYEGKSAIEYALIFIYYLAQIDVHYAEDTTGKRNSFPWLSLSLTIF